MSLNEQLAELCGLERNGKYWGKGTTVYYLQEDDEYASISGCNVWNPTTDLNQLRMCYDAAEKDAEDAEKFESMVYWHVSEDLRLINKCFNKDITTAIFKHPELVAQAILKAKGVI